MKLRGLLARLLALAIVIAPALAQDGQGTSPLSMPKGGTAASTAAGARTNLGLGSMATQNAGAVAISGGAITGMANPANPSDVANKSYVDAVATGLNILAPSALATAAVLPNTPTYANGASGVGATLTAGSNTTLTVDGTAAPLSTVVLVKNQASAFQNGVYTVTQAGSGAAPWILTRAVYFDLAAEMKAGSYTFISSGATNAISAWTLQPAVTTVGTDALNFTLFSSTGPTVSSFNGQTGVISPEQVGLVPFGGRLTLVSGQAVMTTDVIGAQNLYYAPAGGGKVVPVLTSGVWTLWPYTSGSSDQVGLTLALAGSGSWAAGSIHDVFAIRDAGTLKIATREWDSAMLPGANAFAAVANVIVTGTTPGAWVRSTNAFDGTTGRPDTTSAQCVNAGVACFLGSNWTAGVKKALTQVDIWSANNNSLLGAVGGTELVTVDGSNDNVNWTNLTYTRLDNTITTGTQYTILVGSKEAFQYHRIGFNGDGSHNVSVAQIKMTVETAPTTRRLMSCDGVLGNDAIVGSGTAPNKPMRTGAATTVTTAQCEGTWLGAFMVDAATAGQITCHFTIGPSRVFNLFNGPIAARRPIRLRGAAWGMNPYLVGNTSFGNMRGDAANSLTVFIGYPDQPVSIRGTRSAYLNASAVAQAVTTAIGIDGALTPSGEVGSANLDFTGQANGGQLFPRAFLPAFYGARKATALEMVNPGSNNVSMWSDELNGVPVEANWNG